MAASFDEFGEGRERGTAGIAESEELCGLVERLAGSVILRFAEEAVAADAFDAHQLRMAAGHEEGNEREFGPASRKKRREQVSFEMMDPEHRDAQCFAER